MSKSLRNYPDPMNVFDTYGADAMRWYLLSSPILRGGDFSVTEVGMRDTVRQVLLPLWNSYYFLSLYANAEGKTGSVRTDSKNVLDQYVLSKLADTIDSVTASMDSYDLFAACQTIRTFLDVLTNWYIRRSRRRFWRSADTDEARRDKASAYATLYEVLTSFSKVLAPVMRQAPEELFGGDARLEMRCPRCASRHVITRETLEAFVAGDGTAPAA